MNKQKEQSKQSDLDDPNYPYRKAYNIILIGIALVFILGVVIPNVWATIISIAVTYEIMIFLTFRRLIMGIIRSGVKYQPSNIAVRIDFLIMVFWFLFIFGVYSRSIIPINVKEAIAFVIIFLMMWCMWEVLQDIGIKIIALIITAFILMILGTLSKDNWQVMTVLTTALSFILNFENTRLLVKKSGISINDSERNRQNVALAQFCVLIANIFLVLLITFTESMTTRLGKPLTFWLYDYYMGQKGAQNIDYHSFFAIVMDRIMIIALFELCLLIIVLFCRDRFPEFWERYKNFITTKFDVESTSPTSDTPSLDDASTTHVAQTEEKKQD
ncbi:hypothetical protein [Alloscardovia omnicolens]|uniref:hypothetical protein n=1 Tax=Alloscardovia omnicolens TaxID=419015 RepID=UPI003A71A128